ncbi:MAG TPA: hypothetical protein PLK37_09835 [Terricaulis sp.]|nr:hypothetical protein [Terricaulis sp.]
MRIIFLILLVLFAVLVAAFALMNFQPVTVGFAGLELTAPLAILIALVYVLGMASGGGLFSFLRYSIHKATSSPAPKPRVVKAEPPKVIDHAP